MCLAKGEGVVQLLAGLGQHVVEVGNIVVHLRVRGHGYWSSHGVMSWVVAEASVSELVHILSTQTGNCFLHGCRRGEQTDAMGWLELGPNVR